MTGRGDLGALVAHVVGEVTDEVDIDLEAPDGELLQVGKTAEAGNEVVECEATSDLGESVRERRLRLQVAHQRLLRDLEHQVRRVCADDLAGAALGRDTGCADGASPT
jgi:hypothetical protein